MSENSMKAYHKATYEEREAMGCSTDYDLLLGPDGFRCLLGEPEDRTWSRDAAAVVDRLNLLHERLMPPNQETA